MDDDHEEHTMIVKHLEPRHLSSNAVRRAVEQRYGAVSDKEWASVAPRTDRRLSVVDLDETMDVFRERRFLRGVIAKLEASIKRLEGMALFGGLTAEQLLLISHVGSWETLEPGRVLASVGQTGKHVYLLAGGEVELAFARGLGQRPTHVAKAGECVPIGALLGTGTAGTDAVARTAVETFALDRQAFLDLCADRLDISVLVFRNLAEIVVAQYSRLLDGVADLVAHGMTVAERMAPI